ncbi:MAG TPA: rhomboid family intramembrane serine protease [Polyangiaceae bacterium]|nr:rhomboid family intramembrane serine protease [Polyangiaceae bacterium]
MPTQATLCPFCRGLNSAGERRCYRCGRALPGPLASGVIALFKNTLGAPNAMTRLFVGLCIAVFALCFASEHRLPMWGQQYFALSTVLRFGGIAGTLAQAQPWRYFSAIFVHFNLLHAGMNCFVLVAVGATAERELGKARFVLLFLLTGALGFVASDLWAGGMSSPTAGASGAVFGVFGSVIGIAYARRDPNWKQVLLQNVVWIVVLSFMGSVNNAAHVGGLVVGALLGFLFNREPRKLNLDTAFAVVAAILVVLSLASVALSAASPIWRLVKGQESSREY